MPSIKYLDIAVHNFVLFIRTAGLTSFFKFITALGNSKIIGVLLVVAILVLFFKKRSYIFPFLLTIIGSEAVTYFGKILIHRPRPPNGLLIENDFSFPSGHATIAVAFYGFIAFMLITQTASNRKKNTIRCITIILVLLIGFSRLYLGVHYFSDVIAGYMVGTGGLLLGIYAYSSRNKISEYFMKNSFKGDSISS